MGTPAVVDAEVGAREFVQADPKTEAIAGLDIFIPVGAGLGEGLGVGKDHTAEQAVAGDAKPVFGFEIEHVRAAIPPLDVTSARIAVRVPSGARKKKVRGTTIAQREPVKAPDGKDVVVPGRERDIFPGDRKSTV